jgi:hypothetical protein
MRPLGLEAPHWELSAMNTHKPEPLYPSIVRGKICPICGKRAYSLGGIHPQCAVRQADAPRQQQLAAEARERRLQAERAASE